MKLKYIGTLLMALAVLFGCDDNTGSLGMDMLPTSDDMAAHTVSFDVETESVPAESVFAKTSTGYIGRFSDPDFGYYETSFLTALTCTENFSLPDVYKETEWDAQGNATRATGTMTGDSVTDVQLVVYYDQWFGDSLNACRMSAYELNQVLDYDNRYTNINPEDYYDESGLLGRRAYSAFDTTVPDSVRYETNSNGQLVYMASISFPLDNKDFGEERILKPYRNPETRHNFDSPENFINNVFKGVYLTCDQGDGTILYVYRVDLRMQFNFFHVNDSTGVKLKKQDGTDSTYYSTQTIFASTKEVTQVNHFLNSDKLNERVKEKGWTYLKSPAGIFTQATLPYDEIYTQLDNDTLNGARLSFTCYRQEDKRDFSMNTPNEVLLIRKQDYKDFFENNEITDNITSYVATKASGSNQYIYSNIARLVTTCINEKKQAREAAGDSWNEAQWMQEHPDWNKILLIPVQVTYDNSSQTSRMIGIQHDLQPGYAKLQGGPEGGPLKLEVTYTRFQPLE